MWCEGWDAIQSIHSCSRCARLACLAWLVVERAWCARTRGWQRAVSDAWLARNQPSPCDITVPAHCPRISSYDRAQWPGVLDCFYAWRRPGTPALLAVAWARRPQQLLCSGGGRLAHRRQRHDGRGDDVGVFHHARADAGVCHHARADAARAARDILDHHATDGASS